MLELLALQEEQHQNTLQHSAARVCIPWVRQGPALAAGERLESLAMVVHV
jgi:hypothetical protein